MQFEGNMTIIANRQDNSLLALLSHGHEKSLKLCSLG